MKCPGQEGRHRKREDETSHRCHARVRDRETEHVDQACVTHGHRGTLLKSIEADRGGRNQVGEQRIPIDVAASSVVTLEEP